MKHDPRCKCLRCVRGPCPHDGGAIEYASGALACDKCQGFVGWRIPDRFFKKRPRDREDD